MFLYFVPEGQTPEQSRLCYALDLNGGQRRKPPRERAVLRGGPGGNAGTIYTHGSDGEDIGYYPDQQTWRSLPNSAAWIGYQTGRICTPQDLARPVLLSGQFVELCGGHVWHVPTARSPEMHDGALRYQTTLPRTLQFGDDGQWVYGAVEHKYRRLFDIACDWFAVRVDGEDDEEGRNQVAVSTQDAISWSVEVLQFNYRLGPIEVSILGLFNQYNFHSVLDALVDMDRLAILLQKKTESTAEPIATTADGNTA